MEKNKKMKYQHKVSAVIIGLFCISLTGCKAANPTAVSTDEMLLYAMQQEHQILDEIVLDRNMDEIDSIDNQGNQNIQKEDGDNFLGEPNTTTDGSGTGYDNNTGYDNSAAGDKTSAKTYENVSDSVAAYLSTLDAAQEGRWITGDEGIDTYFYTQIDERWADLYYGGTDTIGKYACGPTSMAIVVSSFTDICIDPVQMSAWAKNNNYWFSESGSLHTIIPETAEAFGLKAEGVENTSQAKIKIKKALEEGKLVVALMGKGHFTQGGHFIVLRGLTADGKVLVADPASEERTEQSWDLSLIVSEAKTWAAANGPFWIISK